jgi:hypothetical protein
MVRMMLVKRSHVRYKVGYDDDDSDEVRYEIIYIYERKRSNILCRTMMMMMMMRHTASSPPEVSFLLLNCVL